MKWYLEVLKKYAVFDGRARRTKYWMFFLFNILFGAVIGAIKRIFGIAAQASRSVLAWWLLCGFEQWKGYAACQECGATFE